MHGKKGRLCNIDTAAQNWPGFCKFRAALSIFKKAPFSYHAYLFTFLINLHKSLAVTIIQTWTIWRQIAIATHNVYMQAVSSTFNFKLCIILLACACVCVCVMLHTTHLVCAVCLGSWLKRQTCICPTPRRCIVAHETPTFEQFALCILQKHNWWVCSAESQLAIGDVIVQSFTKNKVAVLCRRTTGEYIMQKHSWRVLKLSCNNSPIQIAVAQVVGNGYVTPSFIKQNYICFSTSVSCASILAAYVYMRS